MDGGEKIVIGLSGGVDSSTAAALLSRAGWDVTGVHLALVPDSPQSEREKHERDARRVAEKLGQSKIISD